MNDARVLETRSDLQDLCRWFEDRRRSATDDFYARFFAMFAGSDAQGGFAIRPVSIEEMLTHLESCKTTQGTTVWNKKITVSERRNSLMTRLSDMQSRLERYDDGRWKGRVFFDLIDDYCVILCGKEAVDLRRQEKARPKKISMKIRSKFEVEEDGIPVFRPGDSPVITVASDMAGFLYLFYQDARDNYCSLYPREDGKSQVYISKGRPHDIQREIAKKICDSFSFQFEETPGVEKSQERLVAIIVEPNVVVYERNVRALMSKAPELSGGIASRGINVNVGSVKFSDLDEEQYACGYLTCWLDCS